MTPVLPYCSALSEHASYPGALLQRRGSPPFGRTPVGGGSIACRGRERALRGGAGLEPVALEKERPSLPARCILGAALIYAGAAEGAGRSGRRRRSVLARRAAGRGQAAAIGALPSAQGLCRPLRPRRHRRAQAAAVAGRSGTYPASAGPSPATTDVEAAAAAAGGAGPGPEGRESSRCGGACPAAR